MRRTMLAAMGGVMVVAAPAPVAAQNAGTGGGLAGLLGGAGGQAGAGQGGMLGGLLPNVAGTSASNAAGLLGYCVKNQLLGNGTGAGSALDLLKGRAGVAGSPGYAAGQTGTVVGGQGQRFSMDQLKGRVKTKVCELVLQRAKSLL